MARRKRETPAAESVILLEVHEHRDILWPAGARIDLRPDQAQRLYRQGIAQPARPVVPESVRTETKSETETTADDGDESGA